MATEAFTVRTEADIANKLNDMADLLDRSRNYIVNQAIKEYLEAHAWQIEKITQSIAAAGRGELVGHDQVMQEMDDLIERKAKAKA